MSGLVPLEYYEHALAHLQLAPSDGNGHENAFPPTEVTPSSIRSSDSSSSAKKPTAASIDTAKGCTLPIEIILEIAKCLVAASHVASPSWLATLENKDLVPPPTSQTPNLRRNYVALLHLSSTCIAYRALLAPLLWHTIYVRHPQQFGELDALMRNYPAVSVARMPSGFGGGGITTTVLPYPLPLVRELHIVVPERFPSFDQALLADLFKRGLKTNLTELEWDAEELPGTSALHALAPGGDDDALLARTALRREEAHHHLDLGGLGAEIGAQDVVRWTRDARQGAPFPVRPSTSYGQTLGGTPPTTAAAAVPTTKLTSISVDCKCFWPGHKLLARLSSVRHLRLASYDSFLLPPGVPPLLLNLQAPLWALSMSTSKTSLFHTPHLLEAGCFDSLVHLDLFPVTPEQPLARAIRRSRRTLRVLRLVLDVSSHFTNFDTLWHDLAGVEDHKVQDGQDQQSTSGPMEALTTLHVDPMPQQNTAPSFGHFVQHGAPALRFVNGRHRDGFAPGYDLLTPDDLTSALYF